MIIETVQNAAFDADLIDGLPPEPRKRVGNPNFKKGQPSPYLHLRPKHTARAGVADPAQRTIYLLEKYGVKKIVRFYKSICKGEDVPVSSSDALIVGRIARAYLNGEELERLYNRSFGKVPDRAINLNLNLDATPEQLSQRALDLLARINPIDD